MCKHINAHTHKHIQINTIATYYPTDLQHQSFTGSRIGYQDEPKCQLSLNSSTTET
jgi:hypothetical protein